MITQSALSLQYVQTAVTATVAGAPYNPTVSSVEFAFTRVPAAPGPSDWVTGSWDGTTPRLPGSTYVAQCLVGPGGAITLVAGTYTMWIRITDTPEVPVINVGIVKII
ncbi:hypothetical protein [Streptomyces sp. NPDC019937]|uniref:hypothetical protein n=1 Tax=Streptomyces sp. NPDC019937 TaxID=3154787 RepID=UPI0033E0E872